VGLVGHLRRLAGAAALEAVALLLHKCSARSAGLAGDSLDACWLLSSGPVVAGRAQAVCALCVDGAALGALEAHRAAQGATLCNLCACWALLAHTIQPLACIAGHALCMQQQAAMQSNRQPE
jgi:hypothetical protein